MVKIQDIKELINYRTSIYVPNNYSFNNYGSIQIGNDKLQKEFEPSRTYIYVEEFGDFNNYGTMNILLTNDVPIINK